jgi:hypothetical protein
MMNKLAVVISAVLVVGLAGCTEDAAKKKCSADCNGRLTTTWCPNHGDQYTGGTMGCNTTTCTLDDSLCETAGGNVAEFGECTGTGQGNCQNGLVCVAGYCVYSCAGGATCATDRYCSASAGQTCQGLGEHGDLCIDPFEGEPCAEQTDYCAPMLTGTIGACTKDCPPVEIDGPANCAAGEYCLGTNFYRQGVACAIGADCGTGYDCYDLAARGLPSMCTTSANPTSASDYETKSCVDDSDCSGLECIGFDDGPLCAINSPICAQVVPFYDGTTEIDPQTGGNVIPYRFVCGIGGHLCGVIGATGQAADTGCETVFGDDYSGICIATCDDGNGGDLDCGTDYTCQRPAPDDPAAFLWDRQGGGVACTVATAADDCDPEYPTCVNFRSGGYLCGRPKKICL